MPHHCQPGGYMGGWGTLEETVNYALSIPYSLLYWRKDKVQIDVFN